MSFFAPPPQTRYDLRFNVGNIPVRVHPLFWLITALLGFSNLNTLFIWIAMVFISILIHEMGHILAMRLYGEDGYIVLHGAGGLAISNNSWRKGRGGRTPQEQIVISLAGPLVGFIFAALIIGIIYLLGGFVFFDWLLFVIPVPYAYLPTAGIVVNSAIRILLFVNVFWGLINLLPVYPLDGGQVSRSLLVINDPFDGVRKSLWVSVITAGIMVLVSLMLLNSVYMAVLFGFLAFQSYQTLYGRTGGLF